MSLTTSNYFCSTNQSLYHSVNQNLYCPINQINNQTLQDLSKEFYGEQSDTNIFSDLSRSKFMKKVMYRTPQKCSLSEKMKTISAQNQVCKPIEFNVTLLTHADKENSLPFSPFKHMYVSDRMTSDNNWLRKIDALLSNPDAIHLIPTGISSSYLIEDESREPLGIYKPNDEAGFTQNNLKGFTSNDQDGKDATVREIGARLIGDDFCNVPEMHQIKLIVNGALQQGSLQKFASHDGSLKTLSAPLTKNLFELCGIDPKKQLDQLDTDDQMKMMAYITDPEKLWNYKKMSMEYEYSMLEKMDSSLHRVGILDILIQNPDRGNPDNLLYRNENDKIKLIPIDHNLAFPTKIQPIPINAIWLQNPSSLQPFDEETKKFVANLNIKKISQQLAEVGMSEERIHNFKIMAYFVKAGVKNNLSILELGLMTTKIRLFKKTELEEIVSQVTDITTDDKTFFKNLRHQLDEVFEKKKKQIAEEGVTDISKHYVPLLKKETFETLESFKTAQTNLQNLLMS